MIFGPTSSNLALMARSRISEEGNLAGSKLNKGTAEIVASNALLHRRALLQPAAAIACAVGRWCSKIRAVIRMALVAPVAGSFEQQRFAGSL
jgi:hypothetical protein